MDRFEAMSMLLEVVDKGSLSAAGRSLRVPVPTLSRKISELEASLGTRLLIRTTRKLTLTDAGITYVAAARRILEQVADAEREAAGEFSAPKGELVVTAPIMFGRLHVLPIVTDFLALFPEINIRLLLADRNVHLVDDHVDMAVRIGPLPDSTMVATRIGSMRMVICASPALLAAHGTPQTPEDLRRMPWVTFEGPMPSSARDMLPAGSNATHGVIPPSRLSVSTAEAAVDAAMRNVGATRLLHYQVEEAVRAGALRIVLDSFEPEPPPIHLVHAARGQMPLKMRSFLDFAAPRLRQALDRISSVA
ncbi:DNA-binding transcriptional LysR family regulator [Neorhizobium sp. 2083]|uniref:LysR family transcriptional regulator n=1 Tax=Neorhizobium sp. 2083 TaxID=2817762 RepID=UPI00285AE1B4|nr:LysR family transcriptional regulator [Neorhizobium sp. 2083]MDR6815927.1 DNA-binding transcriptional LysR family regulator [Neorhizobium sp. 2083]